MKKRTKCIGALERIKVDIDIIRYLEPFAIIFEFKNNNNNETFDKLILDQV
jgi:hypothetical protein